MADTKISALTDIGANLSDDDLLAIIQDPAGTPLSRKVALAAIKNHGRHFIRANVDRSLTSTTSEQKIFGDPTNGRLTLETGVYLFEGVLIFTGMSGTTGNARIDILGAGTAVCESWMWYLNGLDNTTPSTIADDDAAFFQVDTTAASAVVGGTGTAMRLRVKGSFEVTTAGTLIPSIALVTAAAAVVQDGSWFEVERIGDANMVSVGPWD